MARRSFGIYGVTMSGTEEFVETISSAAQGSAVVGRMETEAARGGPFEYIRCRDALGDLRFEFNLHTRRKTA